MTRLGACHKIAPLFNRTNLGPLPGTATPTQEELMENIPPRKPRKKAAKGKRRKKVKKEKK